MYAAEALVVLNRASEAVSSVTVECMTSFHAFVAATASDGCSGSGISAREAACASHVNTGIAYLAMVCDADVWLGWRVVTVLGPRWSLLLVVVASVVVIVLLLVVALLPLLFLLVLLCPLLVPALLPCWFCCCCGCWCFLWRVSLPFLLCVMLIHLPLSMTRCSQGNTAKAQDCATAALQLDTRHVQARRLSLCTTLLKGDAKAAAAMLMGMATHTPSLPPLPVGGAAGSSATAPPHVVHPVAAPPPPPQQRKK
jgi:hypothetical protein